MRLEKKFFRSKVARRILILFVLCALLPIGAVAFLSFTHVTQQLQEQSQRRLHQEGKAAGMALLQRLLFLKAEMRVVADKLSTAVESSTPEFGAGLKESLAERFNGQVLVTHDGKGIPLFGHIQNPPELKAEEKKHLGADKVLLSAQHPANLRPRVLMCVALDPQDLARGILWGDVNLKYLWASVDRDTLPPMTEIAVFDASNRVLFSSNVVSLWFLEIVHLQMGRSISGNFGWEEDGKEYLASYRSLFLKAVFLTPQWTVVMSEPKTYVLAPMVKFKKTFPYIIVISLLVVLLLSSIQIRRNLIPLDRLSEGTRRIARRDFQSRVKVDSGDEFEELANSFNNMAGQLGRQFHVLTTLGEIDRAILSALDTEKIVDTLLDRMRDIFPFDSASVTLLDPDESHTGRIYIMDDRAGSGKKVETIEIALEEVRLLRDHPESFFIRTDQESPNSLFLRDHAESFFVKVDQDLPHFLASMGARGVQLFLVLPVFLEGRPAGFIALGHQNSTEYSSEDLTQARQLADQVAVALSNARLIEELDELNLGTLTALARTIDAKSPWTAGHSERMTQLALKIGQVMGLSQDELDNLHRGGLLHDIGKIGIPAAILNKPGKLTREEYRLVQQHPRIGARILEPISAYANVIPLVLQHHERFDGKGYPDGAAGEAISLGARIFAVADVFDSLISGRPYRTAMDRGKVIESIKLSSGSMFDDKIVKAFLEVMVQEEGEREDHRSDGRVSSVS